MALLVFFVLFLALTGQSTALYCLCKDGVGDKKLQEVLDYACGNGADCVPILPNGPCYEPNTVKDHCNYAVNSYYQRKQSVGGTCYFDGNATTSKTPPSKISGCLYPSSPRDVGTDTTTPPSTGTMPGTSPSTPSCPSSGTIPGTTPPSTPKTPSTCTTPGTCSGTTTGSPDVFGSSPPSTNSSTGGISYSGAVVTNSRPSIITKLLLLHFLKTVLMLALRV